MSFSFIANPIWVGTLGVVFGLVVAWAGLLYVTRVPRYYCLLIERHCQVPVGYWNHHRPISATLLWTDEQEFLRTTAIDYGDDPSPMHNCVVRVGMVVGDRHLRFENAFFVISKTWRLVRETDWRAVDRQNDRLLIKPSPENDPLGFCLAVKTLGGRESADEHVRLKLTEALDFLSRLPYLPDSTSEQIKRFLDDGEVKYLGACFPTYFNLDGDRQQQKR